MINGPTTIQKDIPAQIGLPVQYDVIFYFIYIDIAIAEQSLYKFKM